LGHTGMRWGYPQMTPINADKDRGDSEIYAIISGGKWPPKPATGNEQRTTDN